MRTPLVQFYRNYFSSIATIWLLVCYSFAAYGQPPETAKDAKSLALGSEPSLRVAVSCNISGRPLSEALVQLSKSQRVKLLCGRQVGEQRVSLNIKNQPLHLVLSRMARILSHSESDSDLSHTWTRITDTKPDSEPTFLLSRDQPRFAREEREARDLPRKKIGVLLTDFRNLLNRTPEERKNYKTDLPLAFLQTNEPIVRIYHHALSHLSDKQIRLLLRGQAIDIPAPGFSEVIRDHNAEMSRAYEEAAAIRKVREQRRGVGPTPVAPFKPLALPESVQLRLDTDTDGGERPSNEFKYALYLDGLFPDFHLYINPLELSASEITVPGPDEKIYDLTPVLLQQNPKRPGYSLPDVLQALSEVTGVNIVQEHFYKANLFGSPFFGLPPRSWKGTLPQLLNAICKTWDFVTIQQEDTYLLWSRTWAFDRTYDISETRLAPWRKRLKAQGTLTTSDQIALAVEFTWPQIAVTLKAALETDTHPPRDFEGESFQDHIRWLDSLGGYRRLRIQGMLTADEYRAASTEDGIPVAALSPPVVSEVAAYVTGGAIRAKDISERDALRKAIPSAHLQLRPMTAFRGDPPQAVRVLIGSMVYP